MRDEPKVRFCPFCGVTPVLFIDPDNSTGFGCMKCKREFQVAVRTDAAPPAPHRRFIDPAESVPYRGRKKVDGGFTGESPVDDMPNMAGYGPEDFTLVEEGKP
jgi:hypothetical protein